MNKVINQFNYRDYPDSPNRQPEKTTQPSLTTPDMTMSIKEIVQRFSTGRTLEQFEGIYQETEGYDEQLANIGKMDTMERLDAAKQLKEQSIVLQDDVKAIRAAKAAQKAAKKAAQQSTNTEGEAATDKS